MILLLELNPNDISIDEKLFPSPKKSSFIYEHLRYYCSKFYPLPTIFVRVYENSVIVTDGRMYLAIAKESGHQQIRAIVDRASPDRFVQKLLENPSVTQLDWETVRQEDDDELVSCDWFDWLIFFFKRSLNREEKKTFEEQVVRFFKQIPLPELTDVQKERIKNLSYPHSGLSAEFEAYLPWTDERWFATSRAVLLNFHFNCVPIASFQGWKWQV